MTGIEIKCKYYISAPGHAIKCQGLIPETSIRNIFIGPSEEALERRDMYIQTNCTNEAKCKRCPIYKAISTFGEGEQ